MNISAVQQAFRAQLRRFRVLYTTQQNPTPLASTLAPPSIVLSFAEGLLLCPTEDAVIAHILRDREGARGYYIIASDVGAADAKGNVVFLIPPTLNETPFGLLSDIVIVSAKTAMASGVDSWEVS